MAEKNQNMVPDWAIRLSEWMSQNQASPEEQRPTPWGGPSGLDLLKEYMQNLMGDTETAGQLQSQDDPRYASPKESEIKAAAEVQALMQERGLDADTALRLWNAGERPVGIMGMQ